MSSYGYDCLIFILCAAKMTSVLINFYALSSGNCDFEKSSCGWRNINSDNFDWVIIRGNYSGGAPNAHGDHTFGAKQGKQDKHLS